MPRGRKPDGPDLQAAKGNPGRRKAPPRKPMPPGPGEIAWPRWLSRSTRGLEVWKQLVPLLTKLNLATELDAQPLARYCRYVVEWVTADEAIRREGTWYDATDTNGAATKRMHPAFKAWQQLERNLTEIEASYGMRADSRFKILRDQAAALGGLPLFDQAPAATSVEGTGEARQTDDDVVGLLARLDTPAGYRPN